MGWLADAHGRRDFVCRKKKLSPRRPVKERRGEVKSLWADWSDGSRFEKNAGQAC